ncbi:MAG: pyruvate formate lyase family protein [Candidatus Alcyoniella australis]|nr:pyruvate formate lyase family protein [Candidatus Alcyoniella australis]
MLVRILLHALALNYNLRPSLKKRLYSDQGPIDFTLGIKTEQSTVDLAVVFKSGKVRVASPCPDDANAVMIFGNDDLVRRMLQITPNEVLNLLMKNKLRVVGNMSYLSLFNFYLSLLLGKKQAKMESRRQRRAAAQTASTAGESQPAQRPRALRDPEPLRCAQNDSGVQFLEEQYLSQYTLEDFPRFRRLLEVHFNTRPRICAERPRLLTAWFKENGFETDQQGRTWAPQLRQAQAFRHLMQQRKPMIHEHNLLAGTTTAEQIGVVIYPDTHGTLIWGELLSLPMRELNPYDISAQTVDTLHHEVFPFWAQRNVREQVRKVHDKPLCQQIDERFAVYFIWKSVGVSHTIPDFPKLLKLGTSGIIDQIQSRINAIENGDGEQRTNLEAMRICLQGLEDYAANLAAHAASLAQSESDQGRRSELERLAAICAHVPKNPARTLDEAINAIWIVWIALHMENTNTGLSLGRLDQYLQPYFAAEICKLESKSEREAYVRKAIELVGCLYMSCTDHLPLIPDIGNYLFGGSSSDQAITLGGVDQQGDDAVNDMTYVLLKVTEILAIRDPNVNARYHADKNSDAYLRRLCEVNLITSATPSMHNDKAVFAGLEQFSYPPEHVRDWSATGCVEPTLSGKHMGHTGAMMMNMVAALEMALNNGRHPLMNWQVGPRTGSVHNGAFEKFEDFFQAFVTQYRFCMQQAVEYNNLLGEAHALIRPTPLLSSLIDGCISSGRDASAGGALYNTTGTANIGLADVTDSMLAIKQMVFDKSQVSFSDLKRAIDSNFADDSVIRSRAQHKVPLFGSGDAEAVQMADRIAAVAREFYAAQRNFRGGPYTTGFWSMSNHVAFGTLTGALPSGRMAGKAFTPGLTPQPGASRELLDNLRDVAALDPANLSNNIAFNVKVFPGINDSRERAVERMQAYVHGYFELGGMQMQMNALTSQTLRDAMAHPDQYPQLLVRISGYNAYFVTLNHDMQVELIERAEYGLS